MGDGTLLGRLGEISLLWESPRRSSSHRLDPDLAEHLRVPDFIDAIAPTPRVRRTIESILAEPYADSERRDDTARRAVRARRRSVIEDFVEHDELCVVVRTLAERVAEISMHGESERDRDLLSLVRRLGDLTLLVEIVRELRGVLCRCGDTLASPALCDIRRILTDADGDAQFMRLVEELPAMRAGVRERRSVTIGVNLDDRLRPREAVLLSINESEYSEHGSLDRIGAALFGADNPYRARTGLHKNVPPADWHGGGSAAGSSRTGDPDRFPLAPLFRDLDDLITDLTRPLARALKRFNTLQVGILTRIVGELEVYAAAAETIRRLKSGGLPVCFAEYGEGCVARELYDPVLALGCGTIDVCTNDVELFRRANVAVLTGPNDGGKTTFLRAVGLAHLLAEAGFFVPASSAVITPGTLLASHFAGGESEDFEAGRFAREVAHIGALLEACDERTLVLLNETFSSTGVSDALELARDTLTVIARRGAKALFATHLHDLPARMDDDGTERSGADGVAESVTIRPDRLYRVVRGLPDRRSLARDVARKAGLDFDRLLS
ncbi:MAG: hypothetical protein MI724_10510 [Spirochaetales bacterium]|nr:hypothetical protein [Spirochaetales bacterium]